MPKKSNALLENPSILKQKKPKKHTAGQTAKTESALAQKAGHLEILKGGKKKSGGGEKGKGKGGDVRSGKAGSG